jgi:lysophospholipase L1-like esterase
MPGERLGLLTAVAYLHGMASKRIPIRTFAAAVVAVLSGTLACSPQPEGLTASSASSGPPPPPPPAPVALVVLGSSTAAGYGLGDPATGWVPRYAAFLEGERPGSVVTNLAVSGYTSFQVLPTGTPAIANRPAVNPEHNITAALATMPQALIVNLPSNDAAFGYPVEETLANLHTVATQAEQAGVPTWITTSQPRSAVILPSGQALLIALRDGVLADFGEHAVDFWTPLAAQDGSPLPEYGLGDGIHPNEEGHRLLFEQVKVEQIPQALDATP